MTLDEFREQLGQLIVDSQPIPLGEILEVLMEECDNLRGEMYEEEHRRKK